MALPRETNTDLELSDVVARRRIGESPEHGGRGGGPTDQMEHRVATLEKNMGEIQAALKEIRDGQHKAEVAATKQSGDLDTKFAELGGKLNNLDTLAGGLRRDLEKLPTEYGVARILVFVIGGLGGAAALVKLAWPALSKLFA